MDMTLWISRTHGYEPPCLFELNDFFPFSEWLPNRQWSLWGQEISETWKRICGQLPA